MRRAEKAAAGGFRPRANASAARLPHALRNGASRADGSTVAPVEMDDRQMQIVARVARREGWTDPADPPALHSPRTLDEERAVARFIAGSAPARRRASRPSLSAQARVRLVMVLAALVVLGACWWVSPARTALGLLGAGVVCLIAMRRRRRRTPASPAAAARPAPWAWGVRRPG